MKQHQQQAPVGGFGLLAEAGPPARINRKDNQVMSYRSYDMPYIQDPTVFKAVMFARKLIREDDVPAGVAINRAAAYYDIEPRYVAHYVGIATQRIRERKARQCAGGR